jgi:hypothetical protein
MQRSDVIDELTQITVSEAGVGQARIFEHSRLYHDFGIAGDDVGDILQRIADRWGTDFSAFEGEKYSPSEQRLNNPFEWIASLFTDMRSQYQPLTVGRLADAILEGKWTEV